MLSEMRRALTVGLSLIAIGGLLVALPDTDQRIFSLSEDHGPSTVDAVGVTLVLLGWLLIALFVVRRRRAVVRRAGTPGVSAGVAIAASGFALIVWSVSGDHGAWWLVGVGLAALPQIAAVGLAR